MFSVVANLERKSEVWSQPMHKSAHVAILSFQLMSQSTLNLCFKIESLVLLCMNVPNLGLFHLETDSVTDFPVVCY